MGSTLGIGQVTSLREAIKKRLSFGHCPKVATPLILDTREVTFVLAHFGQP